jgi:hypothetical protein
MEFRLRCGAQPERLHRKSHFLFGLRALKMTSGFRRIRLPFRQRRSLWELRPS